MCYVTVASLWVGIKPVTLGLFAVFYAVAFAAGVIEWLALLSWLLVTLLVRTGFGHGISSACRLPQIDGI